MTPDQFDALDRDDQVALVTYVDVRSFETGAPSGLGVTAAAPVPTPVASAPEPTRRPKRKRKRGGDGG